MSNVTSSVQAPRGALAMIVDSKHEATLNSHDTLCYIPHDPTAQRIKSKRRPRTKDDAIETPPIFCRFKIYHPCNGDFTLVYFCDLECRNTLRFTSILGRFLRDVNKMDQDTNSLQLICITNDNVCSIRNEYMNYSIFSHLASETEYWIMPFEHANRLAFIRMVSASKVPSLFVINNRTGRIITDLGMEAVECCTNVKETIECWRSNSSGVGITSRIMSQCVLM